MSKRQRDIKSKLMAAICMLLVSSIMMVSSTYAWFTLSTAPEVTGIQTAVGANGNLEMALVPLNGNNETQTDDYGITTGTSDSMASQATTLANVTWGNLVDLNTYYGLENITLYPSEVNATTTEGVTNIVSGDKVSILKTPVYGSDGRVSSVEANTISGIYDSEQGKAYESVMVADAEVTNPAGVRLIGTVSGMSDRQLDFRNALALASAAATSAQGKARGALEDNGDGLGELAVKYATGSSDYSEADVVPLKAMVTALKGTADSQGALDYLEEGIRQYVYAYQISTSADETAYLALKGKILGDAETTKSSLADLQNDGTIPDDMDAMIAAFNDSKAAVDDADTKLNALTVYNWDNISAAMSSLVNIQNMSINGMAIYDETTGSISAGLKDKIMDDFIANKGITLTMPTGSGVFADVADFTGNYGATIEVPASAVIEGSNSMIPATMVTAGRTPTWFSEARDTASETTIESDGEATQAISDFYGYVIDLAFKTNAADSSLKLQADAIDRIYSDETQNESTMGGGATMIFASNDTENGFQETEMQELMKHVRVVFFDPTDNNKVLAYGVPDSSKVEPLGGGEISVGMKLASKPIPTEDADYITDNIIMPLEQNKAHRLSVLVYLDGTTITNADVAVGAETSMTGRLNLQFSSTAELVPMEYSDFAESTTTTTPSTPTVTNIDSTAITVTENYSATAYHSSGVLGAVIKDSTSTPVTTGTVTINDQSATYNEQAGAWVVSGVTNVPDTVTIVVGA